MKVNPAKQQPLDLEAERKKCTFAKDKEALSVLYHGGEMARQKKRWLAELLSSDPAFDKSDVYFMSRTERFLRAHRMSKRYFEIRNREGLDKDERDWLRILLDDYIPVSVHESMGEPTLKSQCSPEQYEKWGHMAEAGRILVCYAQTEMAHGSNLSGLATTATFDRASDEWVINTPDVEGDFSPHAKFWIGVLGKTATHAIVQARLISDKDYGMHPFLVPIRSLETHEILPGITIYDMGPKVGAISMDNGYMVLRNVRIPREQLLMKYSSVDREGKYAMRRQDAKQLMRGTMTLVRIGLVEQAAFHLARGMTTAIRYSAVRRQGGGKGQSGKSLEPQILDYEMVQRRLFPLVATSYALQFANFFMRSMHTEMMKRLDKGDGSLLADVHAYSSGLKAYSTFAAVDGIEEARRAIGGQSYSMSSGMADYQRTAAAAVTYEGENVLLTTQTANYLIKQYNAFKDGKGRKDAKVGFSPTPQEAVEYLGNTSSKCSAETVNDFLNPSTQLSMLAHRSRRLVHLFANNRDPMMRGSLSYRASMAHTQYLVVLVFTKFLQTTRMPSSLSTALWNLSHLYTFTSVLEQGGGLLDLLEDWYLAPGQVETIRFKIVPALLAKLRPDAVSLVDAYDIPDYVLQSALGASDGRAYERMFEWFTKREPLNKTISKGGAMQDEKYVISHYDDTLGQIIHGNVGVFNAEAGEERRARARAAIAKKDKARL